MKLQVMMKSKLCIFLSVCVFVSASAGGLAYGQQGACTAALSWLISEKQNSDGSWGQEDIKPFYTTEVVLAMEAMRHNGPSYYQGLTWIENHSSASTDYASRRILALAFHGANVQRDFNLLGAAKRELSTGEHGWGLTNAYIGTAYDTARTLSGLSKGQSQASDVSSAINFLLSTQIQGGGWAFGQELSADSSTTALAILALYPHAAQAGVQDAILAGADILVTAVQSGASSDLKALTIRALTYTGKLATRSGLTVKAAEFETKAAELTTALESEQDAVNASWGSNVYSTALAVQALALVSGIQDSDDLERVNIVDAGLRVAINRALGKNAGDAVTRGEMSSLQTLDASNLGITDLTGLEYADNLQDIDLTGNQELATNDTDGDGLSDMFEASCGTQLFVSDKLADPDSDGFHNLAECKWSTDPNSASSTPLTTAEMPEIGTSYSAASGSAQDVIVKNGIAYIANGSDGMLALDLTTPGGPTEVVHTGFNGIANADALSLKWCEAMSGYMIYVLDQTERTVFVLWFPGLNLGTEPILIDYWSSPGSVDQTITTDLWTTKDLIIFGDSAGNLIARALTAGTLYPHIGESVQLPTRVMDVATRYNHAFVALGAAGMEVVELYNPTTRALHLQPILSSPYKPEGCADVQGVAMAGKHAMLLCRDAADEKSSVHAVDVSTPGAPVAVGSFSLREWSAPPYSVEAQWKIRVRGQRAFVSNGWDGVSILDIQNPQLIELLDYARLPATHNESAQKFNFANAMDVEDGHLYIAGGGTALLGYQQTTENQVDLAKYEFPVIYSFGEEGAYNKRLLIHSKETCFLYTGSSSPTIIADVSDLDNVIELGFISADYSGFRMETDGQHFYSVPYKHPADKSRSRINIVDISIPQLPSYVSHILTGVENGCMKLGQWPYLYNNASSHSTAWSGLHVYDLSTNYPIPELGNWAYGSVGYDASFGEDFIYVREYDFIQAYDINIPDLPDGTGGTTTGNYVADIQFDSGFIYTGRYASVYGLEIYSTFESPYYKERPKLVGHSYLSSAPSMRNGMFRVDVEDSRAYLTIGETGGEDGFYVYDVANPTTPYLLGRYDTAPSWPVDVHVENGLLFGPLEDGQLYVQSTSRTPGVLPGAEVLNGAGAMAMPMTDPGLSGVSTMGSFEASVAGSAEPVAPEDLDTNGDGIVDQSEIEAWRLVQTSTPETE